MKLATKAAVAVGMIGILALGTVPVVAADAACSLCPPGPDWIDSCAAGSDAIADQDALIGIDLDLDCNADTSLVLISCGTDFIVSRGAPAAGTIATEIVDLCLTGGGATMIAGAGLGQGGLLSATLGSIVEDGVNNTIGHSSFDVFFEIDLGGGNFVYNQTPIVIHADITCVPPKVLYIHPTGCHPLFDAPVGGVLVANLTSANHNLGIPTVSEWGMIALVLLVMGAGTIVFRRIRTVSA